MKNIFKIVLIGFFGFLITSCDLELLDPASLPPQEALSKISGFRGLMNSVYRRTHEFEYFGQQAMLHGDVLADNAVIVNRTGRYEQEIVNGVAAYMDRWGRYVTINECNFVIADIDKLSGPDGGTEAERTTLKGEAYFMRALNYFELHRVYSYEPGREVNGWNKGVILRTNPTRGASDADFRARSTNVQGYELMEADLLAAIDLLPATASTPYRATKAAAHALMSRLYLYWGRYGEAATQAEAALASSMGVLSTSANFVASWSAIPHPESIFEAEIRATDWSGVDGANNSLNSITTNMLSGSQYVLAGSQELIDAHEDGDVRANLYINNAGTLNNYQIRKWPAEKGGFLENLPILRRAEVILNLAEARARNTQPVEARDAINQLRTNRGLPTTSLSGQDLIDLIMNERRVELAFEGHRWFDLKRNGLPITKPVAVGTPTLQPNDFRMIMQIRNSQVILNPSLEQNPGW
jgi:starch-binding outer membrane protein, SusD/RagB family